MVIHTASRVFVDTGAFVALFARRDRYHDVASRRFTELAAGKQWMATTNHVIDEACSWLLHDSGHAVACSFGAYVRQYCDPVVLDRPARFYPPRKPILLVHTGPGIESDAWEIFSKYDTSGFSYTDCVSFAVMNALKIRKAFAFDEHFDVAGFERIPGDE